MIGIFPEPHHQPMIGIFPKPTLSHQTLMSPDPMTDICPKLPTSQIDPQNLSAVTQLETA
jgi:hypothetical protein